MRTRNIKINVFLNEDEKQMLLEKSHKSNLSQSDFFRLLIQDYSIDKVLNKEFEDNMAVLNMVSVNLSKLSNELNRLCYYDFTRFLEEQIANLNKVVQKIKK